jgi:alkaline phosphatase D
MAKLILGPIIGGLANDRVNFWGKADGQGCLYAWIGHRPDLGDAVLGGVSLPLRQEDDFAGVAPVHQLSPETRYYYSLSLENRPPVPGNGPLKDRSYAGFDTFPEAGKRVPFRFVFGSCFQPKNQSSGRLFRFLESVLEQDGLNFMLLLGDQVYADDGKYNSLGRPAISLQDYRAVYNHVWSNPALRSLFARLPVFMTLDDHEIDDDWRWLNSQRTRPYIPWWDSLLRLARSGRLEQARINLQKVRNGLQAYWEHQGMHAPGFELPLELNRSGQYSLQPADAGSLAFSFTYGAAAFFVMDTRTMRVRDLWPFHQRRASMLGEGQWRALEAWLLSVKEEFPLKFLVTSSALLFNLFFDFPRDRWSGYRRERQRLLSLLASENIQNVFLLSGDLHSSHAVWAELEGSGSKRVQVWELCSSPFEQTPNILATSLYHPLNDPPIRKSECKFILKENNYGLVEVDYSRNGEPVLRFGVYGESGSLLAETVTGRLQA